MLLFKCLRFINPRRHAYASLNFQRPRRHPKMLAGSLLSICLSASLAVSAMRWMPVIILVALLVIFDQFRFHGYDTSEASRTVGNAIHSWAR